jgi:adenosylhomocysteinase
MKYQVKDIKLAAQGKLKLAWAEKEMPVLANIKQDFKKNLPFKGLTLAACLHVTKETGVLLRVLQAGGARVLACGSNPLSTQDDVAAALASEGVAIFAWKHQSNEDYYKCLNQVLDLKPQITLDDGADLISLIHSKRTDLLKTVFAGQEETTTGVIRLKAMAKDGALKYPVIAINDTPTKHMFDNYYGTGQSVIDGILRSTNILLAGKKIVVAGYGWCGSGMALRAHAMGAHVMVTEVDPVKALKAHMDGFYVLPMKEAARLGDVFLTATGDKNIITGEHMKLMKDGAILGNAGHFNVEISLTELKKLSKSSRAMRSELDEYVLKTGKRIYLIAEGRLLNLAAAEGHPSSVMDMSFSNHALCAAWIVKNYKKLEPTVYDVPPEIDLKVATLKLKAEGVKIDALTAEQKAYLAAWEEGT